MGMVDSPMHSNSALLLDAFSLKLRPSHWFDAISSFFLGKGTDLWARRTLGQCSTEMADSAGLVRLTRPIIFCKARVQFLVC